MFPQHPCFAPLWCAPLRSIILLPPFHGTGKNEMQGSVEYKNCIIIMSQHFFSFHSALLFFYLLREKRGAAEKFSKSRSGRFVILFNLTSSRQGISHCHCFSFFKVNFFLYNILLKLLYREWREDCFSPVGVGNQLAFVSNRNWNSREPRRGIKIIIRRLKGFQRVTVPVTPF